MIGPRLLVNSLSIATFVTKRPMLRLLIKDIRRPLYHLVFVRRFCRIFLATFGDCHVSLDVIEEILEDSAQNIVDAFMYGELVMSLMVILHIYVHTHRQSGCPRP